MNILVTGGAGFIGSNFCNLNKDKFNIVAIDNLFLGVKENLDSAITFVEGDAGKMADLEKCGIEFDAVIHFAGTSSSPMFMGEGFVDGYVNSVESFTRSLEFARKSGAKKFVYASTSSIYGNNPLPLVETQQVTPPNHYAVTKLLYEQCAACYNRVYPEMDIVGFRFMSVYGPNEEAKGRYANMISQFIWDIARDLPPIIYGDGNQTRDFTFVDDIVQAIVLAIESPQGLGNKVYNIGRGEPTSFNDIFTAINQEMGKSIEPVYVPNPVKEGYVLGQYADISLIQKELGFKPSVTLKEGVARVINQLKTEKIKESSSDLLR